MDQKAVAIDGTDGRTDTRPLHRPAPHPNTMLAASANAEINASGSICFILVFHVQITNKREIKYNVKMSIYLIYFTTADGFIYTS